MILIGRVGYACAEAALAVTEPSPIAVTKASRMRLLIMLSSPF
jgi:hypothetical protein